MLYCTATSQFWKIYYSPNISHHLYQRLPWTSRTCIPIFSNTGFRVEARRGLCSSRLILGLHSDLELALISLLVAPLDGCSGNTCRMIMHARPLTFGFLLALAAPGSTFFMPGPSGVISGRRMRESTSKVIAVHWQKPLYNREFCWSQIFAQLTRFWLMSGRVRSIEHERLNIESTCVRPRVKLAHHHSFSRCVDMICPRL